VKQIIVFVVLLLAGSSLFATTFVVTNGNDSGAGSLRQAVADANANPGPDSITMSLLAPYVIQLSSTITITDSVILDGTVSGGMTEIRGASTAVDGLTCTGGASTIRRLIASGFANAIRLQSSGNTIDSCWIGGIGGRTANADGIRVESTASATMITNNVIAGNTNGVESLAGITAGGNLVGLDPSGASAVPNTYGLYLRGGSNLIGGSSGRNVISGNGSGIRTDPFGLVNMSATITGNYIGLDITGSRAVANAAGIYTAQLTALTIGGTAAADRNVISGNGAGIQLNGGSATIEGNTIGLNAAASAKLPNTTGISLFHCIATIGGTPS